VTDFKVQGEKEKDSYILLKQMAGQKTAPMVDYFV